MYVYSVTVHNGQGTACTIIFSNSFNVCFSVQDPLHTEFFSIDFVLGATGFLEEKYNFTNTWGVLNAFSVLLDGKVRENIFLREMSFVVPIYIIPRNFTDWARPWILAGYVNLPRFVLQNFFLWRICDNHVINVVCSLFLMVIEFKSCFIRLWPKAWEFKFPVAKQWMHADFYSTRLQTEPGWIPTSILKRMCQPST